MGKANVTKVDPNGRWHFANRRTRSCAGAWR